MTDNSTIIDEIRAEHRRRRFAMKIQQKLDRALESFVRVNGTVWDPDKSEAEREKINKEVKSLIKDVREGLGRTICKQCGRMHYTMGSKQDSNFADEIAMTEEARTPSDSRREVAEKRMEELAKMLPVYPWVKSVKGAAAPGLATIVAEAGDLSNYPSPAHLWSRLGFAPYDGCAGSTWKRDSWRPRALTKDEWIEHPFSGQRYALMHQIAVWLKNAQWIGAKKTEDGEGKPNGPYGQAYYDRRKRAESTHPDWSKGHLHMDALRVMMKAFLKDLWREWNQAPPEPPFKLDVERVRTPPLPPAQAEKPKAAKRKRKQLEVAE